ncbi:hypothetical protein ACTXT7_015130 [Hymenolepis weldensis]
MEKRMHRSKGLNFRKKKSVYEAREFFVPFAAYNLEMECPYICTHTANSWQNPLPADVKPAFDEKKTGIGTMNPTTSCIDFTDCQSQLKDVYEGEIMLVDSRCHRLFTNESKVRGHWQISRHKCKTDPPFVQ